MDRIISPDTKRDNRLPPGQRATARWPVLHYGSVHYQEAADWTLTIDGLVETGVVVTWEQFQALPPVEVFSDIHCVTRWSRYDNTWHGVSSGAIRALAAVRPEATHVTVPGAGGGPPRARPRPRRLPHHPFP